MAQVLKARNLGALSLAALLAISILAGCAGPGGTTPSATTAPAATTAPTSKPAATTPTATTTSVPKGEAITINFTNHNPPSDPQQIAMDKWAKAVQTRTNGLVTIKVFPAAQLAQQGEVLNALSTGKIEAGHIDMGTYVGVEPPFGVHVTPFMWKSYKQWSRAMDAGIAGIMDELLLKHNVYAIEHFVNAQNSMGTNFSPRLPADFKGKRIRIHSKVQSVMLEQIGAAASSIAAGEVYTAMQRNTIDGYFTALASVNSRNFNEVTKYWINYTLYLSDGVLGINKNTWARIPASSWDFSLASKLLVLIESSVISIQILKRRLIEPHY